MDGDPVVERPTLADGAAMWRLAGATGLDLNSPYKYLVFCRDFASTSAIARAAGETVGFVTGYRRPEHSETLFIWQVGVDAAWRSRGIAGRMLDFLCDTLARVGVTHLEATVTPDNEASLRLFSKFAERRKAPLRRSVLFSEELFASAHARENLLRIGPFSADSISLRDLE